MKKLHLYLFVLLSTLAITSCNDDDEFYNSVYVESPGLVAIEVPMGGYAVADNFEFSVAFSRYITEPSQNTPLDVYKTSEATSFGFSYYLEKKNGQNSWSSVFPEEEYKVGDIIYNPTSEKYEFNLIYPLTTAGEYRFRLGANDDDLTKTTLVSRNPSNKTMVALITNANDIDSQGYYYFDVN